MYRNIAANKKEMQDENISGHLNLNKMTFDIQYPVWGQWQWSLHCPAYQDYNQYIFIVGLFYDTSEQKLTDHVVGYLSFFNLFAGFRLWVLSENTGIEIEV